ncbi:PLP-dependent aminotransferase family protein [Allorhodopirellula solitaria]|uniref:Selenocysteine synthase n=1 Tax=Allorhodopirellula solitaria TaxID=2527987 RepID=A0A5C5WP12_9BACT|nr:hypothetical protein [Allorhodopirellula solitaria]TWT52160.1 selenocysteine synthase [Allorhodopirellula solitaria]
MALPPWTVDLLRRGVADLARQATDHEAATALKEQAGKLVDELPKAAREKVDMLLRQAESKTQPIKDAWQNAAWWMGGPISLAPTRIINGTGLLLDQRGSGVGIPAEALAAAIPHLAGDAARDPELSARLCDEIASTIARRCESDSSRRRPLGAIVTPSLDASLSLVADLGGRRQRLWVPRSSAFPVDSVDGGSEQLLVDRLRHFAHGSVLEFGHASNQEDWPSDQLVHGGSQHHRGKSHRPDPSSQTRQNILVRWAPSPLAKRSDDDRYRDWIEVAVLPLGSLFPIDGLDIVSSVADQLDRCADLVVLDGGVLAGIPELSVMVGSPEVIQQLHACPRHELVNASKAMTAIVATSVVVQAKSTSPVGQLLDISQENLHDRAQRLATQLAGCDWVSATRITETAAGLGMPANLQAPQPSPVNSNTEQSAAAPPADRIPSRQVVLTIDAARNADSIAAELANGSTSLLCRNVNGELVIDLRWISPEQQSQISVLANDV